MGWVRLDDGFFLHRKVVGLTPAAKLLFLAGLTHSANQLTDGFVSVGAAKTAAAIVGARLGTQAKELVEAGLWHKQSDGWDIHDYFHYQPTADQERERRRQTSETKARAGRLGGLRSAEKRRAQDKAEAQQQVNQTGSTTEAPDQAQTQPQVNHRASPDPDPRIASTRSPTNSSNAAPSTGSGPKGPTTQNPPVDPLVQRLTDTCKGRNRDRVQAEAVQVIALLKPHLDDRVIDEAIGICATLATPPAMPRYLLEVAHTHGHNRGVDTPLLTLPDSR